MSQGQGSISYTRPPGAVPPFVNVAGARNGVSLDTSSNVVLGQSIGGAGDPAQLLSNREIPMEGFYLDLFDGRLLISESRQAPSGNALIQLIRNEIASGVDIIDMALINTTPATVSQMQNSPTLMLQGQGFDESSNTSREAQWIISNQPQPGNGTVNSGLIFLYSVDGGSPTPFLTINTFGQIVGGVFTGEGFITFSGLTFNESDAGTTFQLQEGAGSTGVGTLYFFPQSSATLPTALAYANKDDGVNREYFSLGFVEEPDVLVFNVHAQGTGVIRPVSFLPNIRFGDLSVAEASIDIAPGTTTNAPLGLNAGTLLTTPVSGKFEYDGTHLYFTTSTGVRQTVTLV